MTTAFVLQDGRVMLRLTPDSDLEAGFLRQMCGQAVMYSRPGTSDDQTIRDYFVRAFEEDD